MSGEAPEVPRSGGGWAEGARALHALAAVVAALAFAGLFAWEWYHGKALLNPLPVMLVVLSLAIGAGCARTIALRLERVRGVRAVSELLRIADSAQPGEQDGMDEPQGWWRSRLMLSVMSLQIALTGAAGVATLLALVKFRGTLEGLDAWPGVASIVLLEAMYLAWLAEGKAAADELILVALRWARSPSPSGVSQRPSPEASFAARVPFLCDVLFRYGVDLNAEEAVQAPNALSASKQAARKAR